MQSGNINEFKGLSQFSNLKDFNNHIEQWMIELKEQFSKSELIALKRLIRFSASIQGVCYAKIQTIVAATHENDGVGISRSTFKRMLAKAKETGLISIHHTFKNGKQGHSVYVSNRYQSGNVSNSGQVEPPKDEQLNQQESINLSKTSKKLNARNKGLDSSFTSSKVPQDFIKLTSSFCDSQSVTEELWKVITISTHHTSYNAHTVLQMACDSFRQLIRHVKRNMVKKSIYALYWGIVNKRLDEMFFEDLYESGFAVS